MSAMRTAVLVDEPLADVPSRGPAVRLQLVPAQAPAGPDRDTPADFAPGPRRDTPAASPVGTPAPRLTEAPAPAGTPAPRLTGTPAPRLTGTPAPRLTGTPAPRLTGTPAPIRIGDPATPLPAAPSRPRTGTPARVPSERAARPRPATRPESPLRLTRRGRVVVAFLGVLLAAALSLVIAGAAQATSHTASPATADRGLTQVVVQPGQSLWSVAESADPQADTREVVQQIIELNSLSGDTLLAGQRLWVPRS